MWWGWFCSVQSMYAVLCGISTYPGSSISLQVSKFAADVGNRWVRVASILTRPSAFGPHDECMFPPTSDGIKPSFAHQLQAEHFHSHPILKPAILLREKLILFLALHSLCTPKLFPRSAERGVGGDSTVELTLNA